MADGASTDPPETAVTHEVALDGPLAERADPERLFREQLPGLEPERNVNDWGRSERVASAMDATLSRFLYHYWFRVEVDGVDNVPRTGGALLVANRAGQIRVDGVMIAKAIREEHRLARPVHLAGSASFTDIPGLGMVATKLGTVTDHPANLHRLLFDEGQVVLVFPESGRGDAKALRSRYRLRRFDGLEFVEIAMRAGVPIVPVAVVGSEEATPTIFSLGAIGRSLHLRIGSKLPLPARFRIRFLQPVRTDAPDHDRSSGTGRAADLAEDIRRLIQENLYEMVAARRSVWLG